MLPETSVLPSGVNRTEKTWLVCPARTARVSRPATSQSRSSLGFGA